MTANHLLVTATLAAIAALCVVAVRARGYRPNLLQYAGLVGLAMACVILAGRVLTISRVPPDCALAAFSVLLLAIGTGAKVMRYRRPQWCDTQPVDACRASQQGRACLRALAEGTDRKVDMWVNRGIGVWVAVGIVASASVLIWQQVVR